MSSSTRTDGVPETIEFHRSIAQRNLDFIMEQKEEIGQLKAKINRLEQKLNKCHTQNNG